MAKKDEDEDKLPADATSTGMVGEPDEYGASESREAEKDLAASTQKITSQQDRERRRGVFKGLKSLSRRGALTPELLEEARTRAGAAGVAGSDFDRTLSDNLIRVSTFRSAFEDDAGKKIAASAGSPLPEPTTAQEAAESYQFARENLSPMQAYKASLHPLREIGEGGPLGKNNSKPLRDESDPSFMTPSLRAQKSLSRIMAAREIRKQGKISAKQDKLLAKGSPVDGLTDEEKEKKKEKRIKRRQEKKDALTSARSETLGNSKI